MAVGVLLLQEFLALILGWARLMLQERGYVWRLPTDRHEWAVRFVDPLPRGCAVIYGWAVEMTGFNDFGPCAGETQARPEMGGRRSYAFLWIRCQRPKD